MKNLFLLALSLLCTIFVYAKEGVPSETPSLNIYIETITHHKKLSLKRAGLVVDLKEGDEILPGDELNSQSECVRVVFADRSEIVLSKNTEIEFVKTKFDESKILSEKLQIVKIKSGLLQVRVRKPEETEPKIKFIIQTPQSVVGVKGTEFLVQVSPGALTEVNVLEGSIYSLATNELTDSDLKKLLKQDLISSNERIHIYSDKRLEKLKLNRFEYLKSLNQVHPDMYKLSFMKSIRSPQEISHKKRRRS